MTNAKEIKFTMDKTKHIALVAHDGKKKEMVEWCERNKEILKGHFLCGTGTTAKLISEKTGLPVKGYCSGPLGGDQQIGSRIVEGGIDFLIFLLRIAVVYDIPVANNLATADFLLASEYMNKEYDRTVENFNITIQERVQQFQ